MLRVKISEHATSPLFVSPAGSQTGRPGLGHDLAGLLARGTAVSFGLNVASTAIALVTAVLLARLLGAAGYGTYAIAMVYANLLGLVACLGFPQLVVRHVARFASEGRWSGVSSLMRTAALATLLTGVVVAGAAALLAPRLIGSGNGMAWVTFAFGMLLVVPIGLQRLGEMSLLGFDRPIESLLPERLIRPLALLGLVALLAVAMGTSLRPEHAVLAHLAAYTLSLAGVIWIVRQRSPAPWWTEHARCDASYLKESLPLLIAGLMTLLSTRLDMIMLGWLADAEAAGQYRFAAQLAILPMMIGTTAQAVVSPSISRLHHEKRLGDLQPLLVRLAGFSAATAIVLSLAILAMFDTLLPAIGSSFAGAEKPLAVLLLAYGLMAAMFFVLPLLTMTGHAGDVAVSNGVAILCNFALNIVLIPRFGAPGAAVATVISVALLCGLHLRTVRRRLGLFAARPATQ